ncbi:MAG: RnfABCDGE type electron transport complex subunit B [Treponema sp.]|nr:RnfABCDGE type electron transport complex subunit B [Treponema sp.]
MTTIIATMCVALVLAFILGVLLGLFKKLFAVKVDPKIEAVREVLSGGNCGGCGYAGCDAFAAAVVCGDAPATGCVAGGPAVAQHIAEILGVDAGAAEKHVAFLACHGTTDCAKPRGIYNGVKTCVAAQQAVNGTKMCAFGCVGYGDCAEACPFGAISMGANGLPSVDYTKCVGCGKCVKACPKKLFRLIPAETKGAVARCSCHSENKPQIRKDCTAGCFKCGMCARKCPSQSIDLATGIPQIDYTTCTSCGECVKACPDKVLVLAQDILHG